MKCLKFVRVYSIGMWFVFVYLFVLYCFKLWDLGNYR